MCLYYAEKLGCFDEVLVITSFLLAGNVYIRPTDATKRMEARIAHDELYLNPGEHITLLRIFSYYKELTNADEREEFLVTNFEEQSSKICQLFSYKYQKKFR